MPDAYTELVNELKALSQVIDPTAEEPETVTLPVAEDEWRTRPDTVSYGLVSLDFETDQLNGDSIKLDASYEGSADLFSLARNGAGWVPMITGVLTKHCGSCWRLNSHTYERETGLFHWEWVFEVQ